MYYLLFVILALIISLVLLLWAFSALISISIGAPPVATPVEEIFWALKSADPKQGETLTDLGCGDGRVLVVGAQAFNLKGEGYELAPWGNLITKLKIWDDDLRTKVHIHTKNIYKADLTNSNIVYLYLFPEMLKKLSGKFCKDLTPGTRIVSYAFPIPGWKADKIVTSQGNPDIKVYLYHVKKWSKEQK